MARPYKPNKSTYTLVDGSCRTPDGKRVTKDTPGAVKTDLGPSDVYYGKYKDAHGIFRRVKLCTDKTASKQILAKLVNDARLAEHGMADPFEMHHKRQLAEHVADYRRHLESKNNCPRHVADTVAQCKAIIEGTSSRLICDLEADRVANWLAEKRRAGMGISTSNHYLTAIKGFSRWLMRSRRAAADPLIHLSRLNAETDIRRLRRPCPSTKPFHCFNRTGQAQRYSAD